MFWKKTGETRKVSWWVMGEQEEGVGGPSALPGPPPSPRHIPPVIHKHVKHEMAAFTCVLFILFCTGEGHVQEGRGQHLQYRSATLPSPSPPQLDPSHSADVTALAGKTAILNCRVHNVNNKTVSWVRHRDIHLLTVGRYTYTSDQRFRALHEDDSDDWLLKINYVQPRDSGVYECQVSTTPPMSHFIRLRVVEPHTHILGGPDLHVNTGSTINLTCLVEYSPEPPDFIFWSHNNKIISYDSSRGGVTVILEKGDLTTSTLLIQKARGSDSGHYDCSPSNAAPANVTVHVLNGEHPAAMQHGGQSAYTNSSLGNIIFLLVLIAVLQTTVK
ncbi:zwei Ig domain protein zig-8-like [Portunus trituberculatus]|uniref:zwei Ig domain protein zig-8-like n=1 Tax=Portunus trituberculatus TaxID=210409 RepID=UPI001E1CF2C6|nr:zwei Ig domain protein zig-8-like [Portunus trituberculatus]XP_045139315.1 zwei Ig domain protein zig-8-like [Portunus trituberculatus]